MLTLGRTPDRSRVAAVLCGAVAFALPEIASASNTAHEELTKRTPQEQTTFLSLALRSSGGRCTAVSSEFKGLREGDAYWVLRCADQQAFLITVQDDSKGSTKAVDCETAKSDGLDCSGEWKK